MVICWRWLRTEICGLMADFPTSTPVVVPEPSPLLAAMEENLHGHVAFLQRQRPEMRVEGHEDLLSVNSGLPMETFD